MILEDIFMLLIKNGYVKTICARHLMPRASHTQNLKERNNERSY